MRKVGGETDRDGPDIEAEARVTPSLPATNGNGHKNGATLATNIAPALRRVGRGNGHEDRSADLPTIEAVPEEPPMNQPVAAPLDAPGSQKEEDENRAIIDEIKPGQPIDQEERRAVRRQVLNLAWPVIVENLLQTLIGTVDTALVGHLSTDALAGVAGAQQIIWLLTTVLSAVTMGTTVLVARAIGSGNRGEARTVFKQSVIFSAGLAVVIGVLTYFTAEPLMLLLGLDAAAAAQGAIYMQITALTMPVLVAMFTGSAALRGSGNTRTPMMITGFINIINAGAAWALIYGFGPIPALGVAGSAWGAGIARLVGTALLIWVFTRPREKMTLLGRKGWKFDMAITKRMLSIGIPTGLEQFFFALGTTLFGIVVIGLGTQVFATQRTTMTILQMSLLPGFGFGMAATTLVGQAMGARNIRLAELGTEFSMRYCVLLMSVCGGAFAIFADPLLHLFTGDQFVIALGIASLHVVCFNQPFMAVANVLSGSLRGAGDTKFPLITSFVGIWLIRLPLGWIVGVALGFGLQGMYAVYVLDALIRASFVFWRWRQGKWKTIEV